MRVVNRGAPINMITCHFGISTFLKDQLNGKNKYFEMQERWDIICKKGTSCSLGVRDVMHHSIQVTSIIEV
jgi:hypothetical protein